MDNTTLGKIEQLELRTVWKNEAYDFTQWLAKPENMNLLGDEIGLSLNVIETEGGVGAFKTDILAEDDEGRKAIIENRLKMTDHDHLGKIITYASGKDAKILIWITKEARDERKQAVDWLNLHGDEDVNFFLIRMELWRIGDSKPAPKFQVISKPNAWTKMIKESEPTETKLMQLDFWEKFSQFATDHGTILKLRKPRPQHWYDVSIGSSQAHISFTINTQEDKLGCELNMKENKELFKWRSDHKPEIEKELSQSPEWMELPNKKESRIKVTTDASFEVPAARDGKFTWLKDLGERFQKVFQRYVRLAPID